MAKIRVLFYNMSAEECWDSPPGGLSLYDRIKFLVGADFEQTLTGIIDPEEKKLGFLRDIDRRLTFVVVKSPADMQTVLNFLKENKLNGIPVVIFS